MGPEYPSLRVVVTGSREWGDSRAVQETLHDILLKRGEFLLGVGDCPTGADDIATRWGNYHLRWPVTVFHAPWTKRSKAAGMVRNHFMIDMFRPALVLAFPLPQSRGTVDCMKYAASKGIEVRRF